MPQNRRYDVQSLADNADDRPTEAWCDANGDYQCVGGGEYRSPSGVEAAAFAAAVCRGAVLSA